MATGRLQELDERALMARFAAYFFGAGATLVLASLVVARPARAYVPGIVAPCLTAYALVLILLVRSHRLPGWFYRMLPIGGSVLITVGAYSAHDGATAYALLYLWAALYAFYFLPRVDAALQMVLIVALYTLVLVDAASSANSRLEWMMTMGTVAVAAVWVRGLARRLRQRAEELARASESLRTSEAHLHTVVAELEASNRELDQFARVSAHDLQEPLRMVASYVQLLDRRYHGRLDADADEYIGYAVEGATRMGALIRDLLDYSRAGRGSMDAAAVLAAECVSTACHNLTSSIDASNATIVCDELPRVQADASQLSLVFQNLIGNALKFRGEASPRITVSAHREGLMWVFSVRDNGIGIEPHQRERIFAVFQRLHSRERFEGTGIGLAICQRIVEKHGGRIWVEPTPDPGADFCFTLPVAIGSEASDNRAA